MSSPGLPCASRTRAQSLLQKKKNGSIQKKALVTSLTQRRETGMEYSMIVQWNRKSQYCAWDLALLPGLYNVYNAKLCGPGEAHWQNRVRKATKDRIKLLQSLGYDGQTTWQKIRGPWHWHKGVFERDKPNKMKTPGSGGNPVGAAKFKSLTSYKVGLNLMF